MGEEMSKVENNHMAGVFVIFVLAGLILKALSLWGLLPS